MATFESTTTLRELVDDEPGVPHDLRVVLVPDCATTFSPPFTGRLQGSQWSWLREIFPQAGRHAQCYEFQSRWQPSSGPSDDKSAWSHCFDSGDHLLDWLLRLEKTQLKRVPFVFIGNGLGGLVLKKTIARLRYRLLEPEVRAVWDKICHIILIGCPNPLPRDPDSPLGPVLSHDRRISTKQHAYELASKDQEIAASICKNFREAGVSCPILTTYETKPVKTRSRDIIVPYDLARTGIRQETMMELNVKDRDIRQLSDRDNDYVKFRNELKSRLQQSFLTDVDLDDESSTGFSSMTNSTYDGSHMFDSVASMKPAWYDAPGPHQIHESPTEMNTSVLPFAAPQYGRQPSLPCRTYGGHTYNSNFTGRKDILEELDAALLPKTSTGRDFGFRLQTFAIHGLGGLGKTQIALHFAFTRQEKFDAIFWIQADSKTGMDESFARAAVEMDLASKAELGDLAVSFSRMMEWLKNPLQRPHQTGSRDSPQMADSASWLLIYDNVVSTDLLAQYWPREASGSVLVTSRKLEAISFCSWRGINLQPMISEEARALLLRVLARRSQDYKEQEADVAALLKKASGVPLAIVRFASLINTGTLSIDELMNKWEHHIRQYHLAEPQLTQDDIRYQHSLFTVWEFDQLKLETRGLLNVMSLFRPFHIQEDILKDFANAGASAPYPNDENAFIASRSELLDISLVARDPKEKSFALHPLVQDIIHARLYPNGFSPYFETAVRLLHARWPHETQKWSHGWHHLRLAAQLIDHVQSLLGLYEKYDNCRDLDPDLMPIWVQLLMKAAWYLYQRSEYDVADHTIMLAHDLAERTGQAGNLADAHMTIIAIGVHTSSADKMLPYAERHLELRKAMTDAAGPNPGLQVISDLAMGYSALAGVLNHKGDFEKGLLTANLSLSIYRRSEEYRSGRRLALVPVQHQCWALWSLNRHDEAAEILKTSIKRNMEREREDGRVFSYWRAGMYAILGNVQDSLGQHADAQASHQSALDLFYGYNGDGIRTAIAHHKLGDHAARRGDSVQAWAEYKVAMRLFEQNAHYAAELAQVRVKAARFLRRNEQDPQVADELMHQAAATLRALGHAGDVEALTDAQMSAMVKLRSR